MKTSRYVVEYDHDGICWKAKIDECDLATSGYCLPPYGSSFAEVRDHARLMIGYYRWLLEGGGLSREIYVRDLVKEEELDVVERLSENVKDLVLSKLARVGLMVAWCDEWYDEDMDPRLLRLLRWDGCVDEFGVGLLDELFGTCGRFVDLLRCPDDVGTPRSERVNKIAEQSYFASHVEVISRNTEDCKGYDINSSLDG